MKRLLLLACLVACGDSGQGPCNLVANSGCHEGLVCEAVVGGEPSCFDPVAVHGRVTNSDTDAGIAGVRVVAVDTNGGAASNVAISGDDGRYSLPVPTPRNPDGSPVSSTITLRADAAGYQTFPFGARVALPFDVSVATRADGAYVVQSPVTDIALFALAGAGSGELYGSVEIPEDHPGVVVVAELAGAGFSGIVTRDGTYSIPNLAPGHYIVRAYAKGHVYTPAEMDVSGSTKQDFVLSADAASTLNGAIQIVNGGGNTQTSVVIFVESTFDPATGRGVQPPGLRAPEAGAPTITGAFSVVGVPPGRYVVVAAFENDNLVRDPDTCISGTADVHVAVAAGQTVQMPTSFKVTEALAIRTPGAAAAEMVAGPPMLTWADDSSESDYLVEVFDAFGDLVWSRIVPGSQGADVSVAYGGPMTPGMYYQWRVTSRKNSCNLSRSEDLRGVFIAP